jgi:hypothetical protein
MMGIAFQHLGYPVSSSQPLTARLQIPIIRVEFNLVMHRYVPCRVCSVTDAKASKSKSAVDVRMISGHHVRNGSGDV